MFVDLMTKCLSGEVTVSHAMTTTSEDRVVVRFGRDLALRLTTDEAVALVDGLVEVLVAIDPPVVAR